jgi:signal transduction histidine kinase
MPEQSTATPITSEEYKKITEELYKQNLEVVRLYKEVEKLNQDLESANEGQANLLHIINHQIKGYMTKARLVFDDLLNDQSYGLSDKARPMIQQGFDSVTEGVMFVQDFLNASNIDKGTYTYNMMPMDFAKVVAEEAVEQKESAEHKGLAFQMNITPGDYSMMGDKAELTQAVRNLIDNSIKYTPTGSLAVSLERSDKEILFTVRDTGVGLSDEVKPKLFTKGGRDKDSQKINVNSTGFGLAFVKEVIEAHKGKVWAESDGPGKGASFHVALPVA